MLLLYCVLLLFGMLIVLLEVVYFDSIVLIGDGYENFCLIYMMVMCIDWFEFVCVGYC